MYQVQVAIIVLSTLVLMVGILRFLKLFARLDITIFFLVPLAMFSIGFCLRLSGNTDIVDLGYFFTESSYLIVYILFSIAIVLGQIRYWRR